MIGGPEFGEYTAFAKGRDPDPESFSKEGILEKIKVASNRAKCAPYGKLRPEPLVDADTKQRKPFEGRVRNGRARKAYLNPNINRPLKRGPSKL